jgi:hypothetical protein
VGDELNDEKQLLNKAQNAIQLTVAEINKRAGEEQLLSRINQILQYQNVGDFRKYVSKIKDDDRDNADLKNFGELKHHLDIHQIIKFGDCKVQTMLTRPGKKASDSDAMYFLLNEWLVFFVQNKKVIFDVEQKSSLFSSVILYSKNGSHFLRISNKRRSYSTRSDKQELGVSTASSGSTVQASTSVIRRVIRSGADFQGSKSSHRSTRYS